MMIKKLLIANRGEIAVRIIQAAHKLGISSVLACSEADTESMAAHMANELIVIGSARADQSYLNGDAILHAAQQTGADAIHPGYGFLAENPEFASAVTEQGLIFVGPPADVIAMMGDKACAKNVALRAGVPLVPGSAGEVENLSHALQEASRIGYPLLIKASAGGGGRGIRLVHSADDLAREFPIVKAEAKAAFAYDGIYLERFINNARHIEVQILGDGEQVIHLFERECSLQRRRQKIFEEAPAPALTPALRQALCQSAVALAQSVNYRSAGTVEYLLDSRSGEFFFIEMNTRIQVEHPVSEMITGIDIVDWMLRIAGGESLSLRQQDITINGVAIEMRINAEDPVRNFFPSPGTITQLQWPKAEDLRIESHLYPGYQVPPYYDSLLAKFVVQATHRQQVLQRAASLLRQVQIAGIKTTIPLHQALLACDFVIRGDFHTGSLEQWLQTMTVTEES